MPIILPAVAFTALTLQIAARSRTDLSQFLSLRTSLILTAAWMGSWVVISSELLSAFEFLNQMWLTIVWSASAAVILGMGIRQGTLRRGWENLVSSWRPPDWPEAALLAALGIGTGALLVVAIVSPANNVDSLLYHMARVAHWAQNESLSHYPTFYDLQLFSPIWAELAILHTKLLWGGDKLANLVQWASMVGALSAVSGIAALLGASRKGQILSAAFVFSVPMGLLQSTSTQNDYVAAFWLVSFAYLVVLDHKHGLTKFERLSLGLTVGLGILTKGTVYVFIIPFLVWYFVQQVSSKDWRAVVESFEYVALPAALLNAGFWIRNIVTYGGPLGPSSFLQTKTGLELSPSSWVLSTVKHTALNFPTPSEAVNAKLVGAINSLAAALGQSTDEFRVIWFWNHEDFAGNPVHFMLVLAAITVLVVRAVRSSDRFSGLLALAVGSAYLLFGSIIEFDVYSSRHQLLYLVPAGALVPVAVEKVTGRRLWISVLLSSALLLLSVPWILFNATRPLVDLRPRTSVDSVFSESQENLLLTPVHWHKAGFLMAAEQIRNLECRQVGIRIDSQHAEYAIWWLLGAPESGITIKALSEQPHLLRYVDPSFEPCAIICSICGHQEQHLGLERIWFRDEFSVYARESVLPGQQ